MSPADQEKYNARVRALEEAYAPQVQGLQQQISTLPQQFEAQKSALQQAKENAFRDITKTASRGGMFFTGFTPREEARYLGEKYLPGLQQLSAQELSARQGLMGQIAGLQSQQRLAGLSYLDQLEALRRAEEEAARNRAAAASSGFSIGDLSLPPEATTPTPARTGVQQSQQAMLNKGTADNYARLMKSKNTANIKNELNFLIKRMADPKLPAPIKQTINNQYQIFLALAKEYNIDLNKLGPSRAQSAYQAISKQPVINRLTLTPSEYVNQIKTNIDAVKSAYNWMFGAR